MLGPKEMIVGEEEKRLGLVLLHALPLNGSMWSDFMDIIPGATYAPTLYGCGDQLTDWAEEALCHVQEERLIVVGSSIGGSCALEMAIQAPDRVIGIGLIGAKASCNPNPEFRRSVVDLLREQGFEAAWNRYWRPLFNETVDAEVIERAYQIAMSLPVGDVVNGVNAFHTRPDRQAFAERWSKPAVLMSGSTDTHPGSRYMSELSSKMANARFCSIEGSGHCIPLEKPAEAKKILQQFIAEIAAAL
jgi:pimeloyl-ACP methyl ester carboxylesterase